MNMEELTEIERKLENIYFKIAKLREEEKKLRDESYIIIESLNELGILKTP